MQDGAVVSDGRLRQYLASAYPGDGSMRRLLCVLVLLGLPLPGRADFPLITTWVELRVSSCVPATFEASPFDDIDYVGGRSHRTALVTGDVTDAGLLPYAGLRAHYPEEEVQRIADEVTATLPRVNSRLSVTLRQWDAEFCKTAQDRIIRFDSDHYCDTLTAGGPCLSPLPRVQPGRLRPQP